MSKLLSNPHESRGLANLAPLDANGREVTAGFVLNPSKAVVDRTVKWIMGAIKVNEVGPDDYEGYTKEQFMTALKSASRPMAEKAQNARAKGMAGKEESGRFLDDILNAGG